MSIRVVAGLEAAWGYAVAYRGPLLLAYDARLGTFDPLAMPAIDLKSPRQVRPGADNVFPVGSTITVLSLSQGATSLYVVGLDGQIWSNFSLAMAVLSGQGGLL